jgi:tryptophan 7-halogenase
MSGARRVLIVGGGTAGWLTAAYLARALRDTPGGPVALTLLEAPDIGPVGVGEGTFPTIRETLRFIGVGEAEFFRETSATFKQGIQFRDWLHAPEPARRHTYDHPFDAPLPAEPGGLAPRWLVDSPGRRLAFANAVSIQSHVAGAGRAPKDVGDPDFDGPLPYAYHFNARRLVTLLAARAKALGVVHLHGAVARVALGEDGRISHVETAAHGALEADLYIDCSGFRAELIGGALGEGLQSSRAHLFTDRALTTRLPHADPKRLPSYTLATAHEAGWTWDIGLAENRGVGCVYSSAHMSDARAAEVLRDYAGAGEGFETRLLSFEPGYRRRQWIGNCVAVGLSAGFLEPLEATGVVMIEAAAAMIAELFPHVGPVGAPAFRFNAAMGQRFENIVSFLKLHYALSRRPEPFWRENADPATWPARLTELMEAWRHRPPSRFDITSDTDPFAFFNYQYVLYGMGFSTEPPAPRDEDQAEQAERRFARVEALGLRAAADLPAHRALVDALRQPDA